MPTYSRPPVREAIIDIQIDTLAKEYLPKIESCGRQIQSRYPKKSAFYLEEISMEASDTDMTSKRNRQLFGYRFQSSDERKWVRYSLAGFTFNLLKPDPQEAWPGWSVLRGESQTSWKHYAEATGTREIKRFAVRYINPVVIPAGKQLSDYFTSLPVIPKGLPPHDLKTFFSRVAVHSKNPEATIVITQAPIMSDRHATGTQVVLDIDIQREQRMSVDSFDLWDELDRFREVKNTVFEASLSQTAKHLFGPKEEHQ